MENFKKQGIEGAVLKPFGEKELLAAIRDVLSSPLYDLSSLVELSGENDTFFNEMVLLFLKGTGTGLEEMAGHFQLAEWEEAAAVAHRISPPCKQLKATVLYRCLKDLETELKGPERPGKAEALLKAAELEFEQIKEDIYRKYNY
jgi:HPt (histidine-containing phosphotransfer) domain-containing protein